MRGLFFCLILIHATFAFAGDLGALFGKQVYQPYTGPVVRDRIVSGLPDCSFCEKDTDATKQEITVHTNNGDQPVTILDKARLEKLYVKIRNLNLGYGCTDNGCQARAQAIAQFLDENHIQSAKVFVTGKNMRPSNVDAGMNGWDYHVAPVIYIRAGGGRLTPYVLDPALFYQGAVDLNTWVDRARGPNSGPIEHMLTTKYTYNAEKSTRPSPTNYLPEENDKAKSEILSCTSGKRVNASSDSPTYNPSPVVTAVR